MGHGSNSIGKYRFLRMIGEGSFAKVKLAVDSTSDQYVAIKIIDKHTVMESNLKSQVWRFENWSDSFLSCIRVSFCLLGECFQVFLVSKNRGEAAAVPSISSFRKQGK